MLLPGGKMLCICSCMKFQTICLHYHININIESVINSHTFLNDCLLHSVQ